MDLLDDETHDRVVQAIPNKGHDKRSGYDANLSLISLRIAAKNARRHRVLQQECADEGVAGIAEDAHPRIDEFRQLRDLVSRVGSGRQIAARLLRRTSAHMFLQSLVKAFKLCLILALDRKSTRLNSSHQIISYAVFCLKKKT